MKVLTNPSNTGHFILYKGKYVFLEQTAVPDTEICINKLFCNKFVSFASLYSGPIRIGYAVACRKPLQSSNCLVIGSVPVQNHVVHKFFNMYLIEWTKGILITPVFRGIE